MTDTITIPRALLEQVLEALEHEAEIGNDDAYREERDALRSALEQPQQNHRAPLEQALEAPGCERIKDFYAVGPVQRAAVESFAEALHSALEQSQQPEVCCGKYATCLKACTPRGRWLAKQEQPQQEKKNT